MLIVFSLLLLLTKCELYSNCPETLYIGSQRFIKRDIIWESDIPWAERFRSNVTPRLNKIRRGQLSRDRRNERWEIFDTTNNVKGLCFFSRQTKISKILYFAQIFYYKFEILIQNINSKNHKIAFSKVFPSNVKLCPDEVAWFYYCECFTIPDCYCGNTKLLTINRPSRALTNFADCPNVCWVSPWGGLGEVTKGRFFLDSFILVSDISGSTRTFIPQNT